MKYEQTGLATVTRSSINFPNYNVSDCLHRFLCKWYITLQLRNFSVIPLGELSVVVISVGIITSVL